MCHRKDHHEVQHIWHTEATHHHRTWPPLNRPLRCTRTLSQQRAKQKISRTIAPPSSFRRGMHNRSSSCKSRKGEVQRKQSAIHHQRTSPPRTRYLSLSKGTLPNPAERSTYYLLLTTHYSLLTTYCLLLTTYYLQPSASQTTNKTAIHWP